MDISLLLTGGSLTSILLYNNVDLRPLVQILDSKLIEKKSLVRVMLSDGVTTSALCGFQWVGIEQEFSQGRLTRFTVVRLDEYRKVLMANQPAIIINRVTIIKPGLQIDHQLRAGECFVVNADIPIDEPENPQSQAEIFSTAASTLAFPVPDRAPISVETALVSPVVTTPIASSSRMAKPRPTFTTPTRPAISPGLAMRMPSPAFTSTPIRRAITPGTSFTKPTRPFLRNIRSSFATPLRGSITPRPPLNMSSFRPANSPADGPPTINRTLLWALRTITPFYNAWVIRVRITRKSRLITYNKNGQSGKLFSFDVIDSSGEMRITAFNAQAEHFYEQIEEGKVYFIAKGNAKPVNRTYNKLSHDFEVNLNQDSLLEPCLDADVDTSTPQISWKFLPLNAIATAPSQTIVDLIGVIRLVGEIESVISKKAQKAMSLRNVFIVDKSLAEVRIALWHEEATNFKGKTGQILAVKSGIVNDFLGKSVSCPASLIKVNPEFAETSQLREWYTSHGHNESFSRLIGDGSSLIKSERAICQITPRHLKTDSRVYFTIHGTMKEVKKINNFYKGCGMDGCQKKVSEAPGLEVGTMQYHCPSCKRNSNTYIWRMMLRVSLVDPTGIIDVTIFHDLAKIAFAKDVGRTVEELATFCQENSKEYERLINRTLLHKLYTTRIGVKLEWYNGVSRLNAVAFSFARSNPQERAQQLMSKIGALSEKIKVMAPAQGQV